MHTLKEAAKILNLSVVTMRRYIKEGKIKAVKTGREYRISNETLQLIMPTTAGTETADALVRDALNENGPFKYRFMRGKNFQEARELYLSEGNKAEAERAQWDNQIFNYSLVRDSYSERRNKWGRFAPKAVFTNNKDQEVPVPDPAAIDQSILEHARKRAAEVTNPVTLCVYHDLLFEYSKGKDRKTYGTKAVDSYFASALETFNDPERDMEGLADLLRALELVFMFKDKEKITKVVDSTLTFLASFTRTNPPRIVLEVARLLSRNLGYLTSRQVPELENLIEKSAKYYLKTHNEHLYRSFIEEKIGYYQASKKLTEVSRANELLIESFIREAESRGPDGGIVQGHFYAEAYKVAAKIFSEEKLAKLRQKIETANLAAEKDMKEISVEVKIKNEDIKKFIQSVLVEDFEKSFVRIALLPGMIPTLDKAKEQTKDLIKKYPMQYLMGRNTLQDGRVIRVSPNGLVVTEDHILDRLGENIEFSSVFLGFLFDEMKARGLTAQTLSGYLAQKDFFNNKTINPLSEGIQSYFDGKYYAALGILITQLEQLLRLVNRNLGLPTMRVEADGRQCVIHFKEILQNLEPIMTSDMYQYFCLILWDKRGPALRDSFAHGLLEHNSNNKRQAEMLLHLLLILAQFEYKNTQPNDENSEPVKDKA